LPRLKAEEEKKMSKARTIVVTQEQGQALELMFDKSKRCTGEPLCSREYLVNTVIRGHRKDWKNDYEPLDSMALSDLLYIVTGGVWEVQKTMKEVLEELHNSVSLRERDGVLLSIATLKERGFIQ
jgi:hypothetical protein